MPIVELASAKGNGPRYLGTPWWSSQWNHRTEITVSNSGSSALFSFPVKLEVQYSNFMEANFSDIRFVIYNSTTYQQTKLAYWVEAMVSLTNASIWVNITQIPAHGSSTVDMYYGNPTVVSESNGPRTFDLFDDFNSGDLSNWTLDTSCGTGTMEANNTIYHSPPYSLLTYLMNACGSNQYSYARRYLHVLDSDYLLDFYARSHACQGCTEVANVLIDGNSIFYQENDGPQLDHYLVSNYIYHGYHSFEVGLFTDWSVNGIFPAWFDDIILRKVTTFPPTVTFGPEETQIPVVLKTLSYQPKTPSEKDEVKVTAEFYNPSAMNQHILISFFYGDNYVNAVKFNASWMDITPTKYVNATADWTAVGGLQTVWCAVNASVAGSILIKVNRFPTVLPLLEYNATEHQTFSTIVYGYDPDGDPLNWSVKDMNFTIVRMTDSMANLTFTPTEADVPSVNVTVYAKDILNKTGSRNQKINVKDINEPPSIDPIPPQKAMVGVLFTYHVNATDPDMVHGETLKFGSSLSYVTINAFSGIINFTPNEQYVGTFNVTITVVDSRGLSNSTTFTLVISSGQHPPKLMDPGDQTLTENKPYNLTVKATDPDIPFGDHLQFFDDTDMFVIGRDTGRINFTPTLVVDGLHFVNITVKDAEGLKDTVMVRFMINPIPHAPILGRLDNVTIPAYQEWYYNLTANDYDIGDKLVFSGRCDLFTIPADGKIKFKPSNKQVGSYEVNVTATDKTGLTDNGTFWINIEFHDRPPWDVQILSPSEGASFPPGSIVKFSATVTGASPGDVFSYRWIENGRVIGKGPQTNISLEPGDHLIMVEVTDGTATMNRTIIVMILGEGSTVGSLMPCISLTLPFLLTILIALVLEYIAIRRREKAELDAYRQQMEKRQAQNAQATMNKNEIKMEVKK